MEAYKYNDKVEYTTKLVGVWRYCHGYVKAVRNIFGIRYYYINEVKTSRVDIVPQRHVFGIINQSNQTKQKWSKQSSEE